MGTFCVNTWLRQLMYAVFLALFLAPCWSLDKAFRGLDCLSSGLVTLSSIKSLVKNPGLAPTLPLPLAVEDDREDLIDDE